MDDDAACDRSESPPDKRSVPVALSVDDAVLQRGYDDDGASCECDYAHGPSCDGEGQGYCTRYSGDYYGTPEHCPRDPGHSLGGICCSSDEAPGHRDSYQHLFSEIVIVSESNS